MKQQKENAAQQMHPGVAHPALPFAFPSLTTHRSSPLWETKLEPGVLASPPADQLLPLYQQAASSGQVFPVLEFPLSSFEQDAVQQAEQERQRQGEILCPDCC
jgi:hypothetical protein